MKKQVHVEALSNMVMRKSTRAFILFLILLFLLICHDSCLYFEQTEIRIRCDSYQYVTSPKVVSCTSDDPRYFVTAIEGDGTLTEWMKIEKDGWDEQKGLTAEATETQLRASAAMGGNLCSMQSFFSEEDSSLLYMIPICSLFQWIPNNFQVLPIRHLTGRKFHWLKHSLVFNYFFYLN